MSCARDWFHGFAQGHSQGSKVGIRGLWGPLGAFVRYWNISCFQISFNLASNHQRQEISIDFHSEQNQIMLLEVIGPCFKIGFNLADI